MTELQYIILLIIIIVLGLLLSAIIYIIGYYIIDEINSFKLNMINKIKKDE